MVFCNMDGELFTSGGAIVTILILIDGFLQLFLQNRSILPIRVTILILIDGFLQFDIVAIEKMAKELSQSLF